MGFRTIEIDAFLRAAQIDAERRAHAANAAALRMARVSQAPEPPYSGNAKGRAGDTQTDGVPGRSTAYISAERRDSGISRSPLVSNRRVIRPDLRERAHRSRSPRYLQPTG